MLSNHWFGGGGPSWRWLCTGVPFGPMNDRSLMSDMILALIEQAVRAPSSHNTQPWLFRVREAAVEIHADLARALPVNDPHNRELYISCGAALFNLEVAAARAGVGTKTTPLPDPSNP